MDALRQIDTLAAQIAAGQRAALARALSLAERDATAAQALLKRLDGRPRARIVGITGPAGAGKSTLLGRLVEGFLGEGLRIAMLAIDPSSPLSGGALLGDRFRIDAELDPARCFIRSLASRGRLGGLSAAAPRMSELLARAGYDLVLVETVGSGQTDIAIAALADILLAIFPPGLGDELQAMKGGILELADLIVVSKADLPGATAALDALHSAAQPGTHGPRTLAVSASSGLGLDELRGAIRNLAPRQRHIAASGVHDDPLRLRDRLGALLPEIAPQLAIEFIDARTLRLGYRDPRAAEPFHLGLAAGALRAWIADAEVHLRVEVIAPPAA